MPFRDVSCRFVPFSAVSQEGAVLQRTPRVGPSPWAGATRRGIGGVVAWAASARREHARVTVNKVTTHLLTHYCLTLYYGDAGSADDDGRGGLARRGAGRVPSGGGDGNSGGAAAGRAVRVMRRRQGGPTRAARYRYTRRYRVT